MKLVLVTDAWLPQVNGVVSTLVELVRQLQARGDEVVARSVRPVGALDEADELRRLIGPGRHLRVHQRRNRQQDDERESAHQAQVSM